MADRTTPKRTDLTSSPRVVGTQRADFYSLRSILESPQFAGKSGEELVLALYNYFTSTVDGTYHFWPQSESVGTPRIRNVTYDPIKLLNCYGWLICGQHAALLYSLYHAAGLKTRQIGVPGHNLCEVFYDERWHILDVDMWTWFRTPEGHIASAYELAKSPQALVVESEDKSRPCNLPDRTLDDYAKMYAATPTVDDHVKDVLPPSKTEGHTMDFQLRPGETLIRSTRAATTFRRIGRTARSVIPTNGAGYPTNVTSRSARLGTAAGSTNRISAPRTATSTLAHGNDPV